jgi:hypothetical protein
MGFTAALETLWKRRNGCAGGLEALEESSPRKAKRARRVERGAGFAGY